MAEVVENMPARREPRPRSASESTCDTDLDGRIWNLRLGVDCPSVATVEALTGAAPDRAFVDLDAGETDRPQAHPTITAES